MAGSLNHIVDDATGQFRMGLIENMGDAREALDECFKVIRVLSEGGNMGIVNAACVRADCTPIDHRMNAGGPDAL
jgi:hypothetical protein